MIEENEILHIKDFVKEFLEKMTISVIAVEAKTTSDNNTKDSIDLAITIEDPQMLIGQGGQTLFELTRLLKIMLNKRLKKDFYVDADINDYKKKKIEYLKDLALSSGAEVAKNKETKVLPPMPSYERRIIHAALSQNLDVATQSQGEGSERCIVISPK